MSARAFLPLLCLFFLNCVVPKDKQLVPLPPLYDNACEPSHDYYVKMAFDTQDLAAPGEISSDPQEALRQALEWIKQFELNNGSKLEIVQKPVTGIDQFDKFTTTLPERIYVKDGFFDMSPERQAEILWHEIVHVRQWTRLGTAIMAALWTKPHGRFALESAAYRESVRSQMLFGASPATIEKYAERRTKSFYESYALQTISWACFRPQVMAVLTADLQR